jgi:hypothetical protein
MPNRRLTAPELQLANELLARIRENLELLSAGDPELLFAYRRKVFKELTYDERDKPMFRRKLKSAKRKEQGGICPICNAKLPEKYCVLDRFHASSGYTVENTRLICQSCDVNVQVSKNYS